MIVDDASASIENPGDEYVDCLHQKNIKVSNIENTKLQSSLSVSLLSTLLQVSLLYLYPSKVYFFLFKESFLMCVVTANRI